MVSMTRYSEEIHPKLPNPSPVELYHTEDLPLHSFNFPEGKKLSYKMLLGKDEITVLLFSLPQGEEIPLHYHTMNKAIYVYEGCPEILIRGEMTPTFRGDSLMIPEESNVKIQNSWTEETLIFFFFPGCPRDSLMFQSPSPDSDPSGRENLLFKEREIPWENWDGKLSIGTEPTPLAWKTIIENDSMVLGITKIDPGFDVDRHYHKPTQIVIFSEGEGRTLIEKGEYREIRKDSFIYPPSYSLHHSLNTHPERPLMEIYFFPQGPFAKIEYLGKE